MAETITREQYMKAYKDAPEIVRAVYDADLTVQIIVELQTKYKLHVDDAGLLGKGIGYMLLGLVNPQEFLNELIAAKVPEKDAREIMTEINQKIFVPLRQEMMKSGTVIAPQPPKPVMPRPSVALSEGGPQPPRPAEASSVGGPRYFHLENKLPPAPHAIPEVRPSPTIPKVEPQIPPPALFPEPPRPASSQQPFVAKQIPPAPAQPSVNIFNAGPKVVPQQPPPMPVRPPVSNIAPLPPKIVLPRPAATTIPRPMLPVGERPSALRPAVASGVGGPRPMNMPQRPTAETPLQQALRTVLPRPAVASGAGGPPANLPGAMPPADIISSPKPVSTAPLAPVTPPKSYSADPYREPIES